VKLSSKCLHAVKELRESYSMADASPFSYVSSISPHLNIYCEPPEFLEEWERKAFEPIAFYGSIPFPDEMQSNHQENRIYFGRTVVIGSDICQLRYGHMEVLY